MNICPICKKRRAVHHHHCLFGRDKRFKQLNDEENIELLCEVCHLSGLGDTWEHRQDFWVRQCKKYGREHMLKWLESLPLKNKPRYDLTDL